MMDLLSDAWAITIRDLKKSFSLLKQLFSVILTLGIIIIIGEGINKAVDFSKFGQSYASFFSGGMLAYLIAAVTFMAGSELVADRNGFAKLLFVAPVSRVSIIFGKMFYLFIIALTNYFVMSVLLMIYLGSFSFMHLFLTLFAIIVIALAFVGMGFIVSSLAADFTQAQTVSQYLSMFFLLGSGIFYPIKSMPAIVQYVFYINPLTYGAELIRYSMTGYHELSLTLVISASIILAIVLPLLGVYLYERRQRARR
jgi:ABC-2 type transport system permease protein